MDKNILNQLIPPNTKTIEMLVNKNCYGVIVEGDFYGTVFIKDKNGTRIIKDDKTKEHLLSEYNKYFKP